MVGASPRVPPGLAFGQGEVWQEGSQRAFNLVWFTTQGMLSRTVVRTLAIETDIIGWGGKKRETKVNKLCSIAVLLAETLFLQTVYYRIYK